jgi:hypothetical protein
VANGALLPLVTKGMADNGSFAVSFAFTVFDNNPIQTEAPRMMSSGSTSPHLVNRLRRGNVIL